MKSKNFIFPVIFFLSVFTTFASTANAQEFRLIQGFNLSNYSFQPDEYVGMGIPLVVLDLKSNFLAGLLIGGGIEFNISKNIAVEIDALYFQKGSLIKADEVSASNYDLSELSFPILIKIKPSSGLPAYHLLGGGELSLILKHKVNGTNITEDTKILDYGLVTGGGVEIKLKNSKVYIEGRYHIGLKNISKATWPWQLESIKPKAIVLLWGIKI